MWNELESIVHRLEEEKGRIIYNVQELETATTDNGSIATNTLVKRLQDDAGVRFNVPRTMKDALVTFFDTDTTQYVLSLLLTTIVFRLLLSPALGISDLITIGATRILWEVQEWAIHSYGFHGKDGDNHKAFAPFKQHDIHHNLPYFHIAIEPKRIVMVWSLVAICVCCGFVSLFNDGCSSLALPIATTGLATYVGSALAYMGIHYLTHTKVPFPKDSWLQKTRENHIKHHQSPTHNLNMYPNNMDKLMNTTS